MRSMTYVCCSPCLSYSCALRSASSTSTISPAKMSFKFHSVMHRLEDGAMAYKERVHLYIP